LAKPNDVILNPKDDFISVSTSKAERRKQMTEAYGFESK
jgi:hypothetical protein